MITKYNYALVNFKNIFHMNTHSIATITATPKFGLVDEPFKISITGLIPDEPITISCQVDESGRYFESYGYYKADSIGNIKLDKHPSLGGSYQGIEQHGLLWSLIQNPGQKQGLRIIKQNVDDPFKFKFTVYKGHEYCSQSIESKAEDDSSLNDLSITEKIQDNKPSKFEHLCETIMYRVYQSSAIKVQDIRHGKLRGRIYIPEGDGPFPAVIDMFGTNGGLITFRSALLASRGIMSYALPYFNYDDLPSNIILDYQYFEDAMEYLYKHQLSLKTGIGLIGVSKGATLALEMSTRNPKVLFCIAINTLAIHAAGTHFYKGVPMPCFNDYENIKITDEGISMANSILLNESTEHKLKDYIIPIQNSENADFVFINGEDDQSIEYNQMFYLENILKKYNKSHKFFSLSYPGAGHLIEPPIMPVCRSSYAKFFGTVFLYGGWPKEHSVAQEDSWKYILNFIKYKLDPKYGNKPPTSKFLRSHNSKL